MNRISRFLFLKDFCVHPSVVRTLFTGEMGKKDRILGCEYPYEYSRPKARVLAAEISEKALTLYGYLLHVLVLKPLPFLM